MRICLREEKEQGLKLAKKLIIILLLVSTLTAILPLSVSASGTVARGVAAIDSNGVRIHSGPGSEFSILTLANRGDFVVVLERTNNDWFKVNYHGTVGFISAPLLRDRREIADFNASGMISGRIVNIRARPNMTASILTTCRAGTEMFITGINDGWYKVEFGSITGYVRSDVMSLLPRRNPNVLLGEKIIPTAPAPDPNLPLGKQIADYGVEFVGIRYKWGGNSPSTGFDCSGFVTYIMRQYNINLTRTASGQYKDNGTHILKSDLVPGDLVFFSSNGRTVTHVGIYIGDGKFVHASGSLVGVIVSDLDSVYYTRSWWGAKRVVE